MSVKYLEQATESNNDMGNPSYIWEYSDTVAARETGVWLILPDRAGKVDAWLVSLIPSGGTARIEITGSVRADVLADSAQEYSWDDGNITISKNDALFNVSAVRAVGVTGSAKIEVRVS